MAVDRRPEPVPNEYLRMQLRRRRNEAEYPRLGSPRFSADDVRADIPKVEAILEIAGKVIDSMRPF